MSQHPSTDPTMQRQSQHTAFTQQTSQQLMAERQPQQLQHFHSHLSPTQQDLLLAALNSHATGRQQTHPPPASPILKQSPSLEVSTNEATRMPLNGGARYISPQQATLDDFQDSYSPDLDYLDADGFDFENADLGGEMIGSLPGDSSTHEKRKNSDDFDELEEGDAKRQETQDGEKSAKKPGRKLLTNEPTTKRKAQNRAAQRAFRERKEKHLKDLETKVSELEKAKEVDQRENGILKAKLERLTAEMREYKKRIFLNAGSGANRSPPASAQGVTRSNSNPSAYGNAFQFDFPKFGALPGSQIFGSQSFSNASNSSLPQQRSSATPPNNTNSPPTTVGPTSGIIGIPSQQNMFASRQNSQGPSMSPTSMNGASTGSPAQNSSLDPSFASYSTNDNMHGFASTLPQMATATNDPFGDLFSPGLLKSASVDSNSNYFADPSTQANARNPLNDFVDVNGGDSTAGLNRVFQFNSNSSGSDTASPSASSGSQWNGHANSSTGTSPEPSHGSPGHKSSIDKTTSGPRHQSPLATSNQISSSNDINTTSNQFDLTLADYSLPSLTTFDPVLFGDYRDSQDAILGGGDFTGGFFDEALQQPFDYSSPSNLFGILQSPQPANQTLNVGANNTIGAANAPTPSKNLMAEMEKARDGGDDDYGLSTSTGPAGATERAEQARQQAAANTKDDSQLISCNSIWNQLQTNPSFQKGEFDLDSLCSELKAKARCSESGVVVDQAHVNAALKKLGTKDEGTGKVNEGPRGLMFEQESWDKVLKRLGSGAY